MTWGTSLGHFVIDGDGTAADIPASTNGGLSIGGFLGAGARLAIGHLQRVRYAISGLPETGSGHAIDVRQSVMLADKTLTSSVASKRVSDTSRGPYLQVQ